MIKFILVLVFIYGAWNWYSGKSQQAAVISESESVQAEPFKPAPQITPAAAHSFSCDGRQHCSQMSSCEEATFFLNSCPGTKMDGDHDGVPCEDQLCGH